MKRIAAAALIGTGMTVVAAVLGVVSQAQGTDTPAPVATVTHTAVTAHPAVATRRAVVPTAPARCTVPAPTTVKGYANMFGSLDTREWGAADGSMSVRLPDGRSLWYYGDTFSAGPDGKGRFVHSTAIMQDRGCLHVSHGGAQLIPNDDAHHIYWIEKIVVAGRHNVLITGRTITLVGTGPWDFRDGGYDHTALATVNAAGDVSFVRWASRKVHTTVPSAGPMIDCEAPAPPTPHHFCYGRHTHPEAHLANGRTLVTTNQNWDDGILHPFAAYRPIFSQQ